jgi:hypothetical protein
VYWVEVELFLVPPHAELRGSRAFLESHRGDGCGVIADARGSLFDAARFKR